MMHHYRELATRYGQHNRKRMRMTTMGIVLAVALVAGVLSMLDSLAGFEKQRVLREEGNYHFLIRSTSEEERTAIQSRRDVRNSGTLRFYGNGQMFGSPCAIASLDGTFAENLNFTLTAGTYPEKADEIMLEAWVMTQANPPLQAGDPVHMTLPDGETGTFVVSGQYQDLGATKAAGIPGVFLSVNRGSRLKAESDDFFIQFREGVKVAHAEDEIVRALSLDSSRLARNERLLALTFQSRNSRVLNMALLGFVLFGLVLVTGIVMIANTLHISVIERVRHFGLLRCIGATPRQIRRLVRREGMGLCLRAIPVGLLAGVIMNLACCAILKRFNPELYGDLSLLQLSWIGLAAGAILGWASVSLASALPARRAGRVSPIEALAGAESMALAMRRRLRSRIRTGSIAFSMGIRNAMGKKGTLFLTSASVAFGITLLLAFNFLAQPEYMGMKSNPFQTPDVSITSVSGIPESVCQELAAIKGVRWSRPDQAAEDGHHEISFRLRTAGAEAAIVAIREKLGPSAKLLDKRQFNRQARSAFLTTSVFLYGFVGILMLISLLNIANTMRTSVATRVRHLGILRAVGMTGPQLMAMLAGESTVYMGTGCAGGFLLGCLLRKALSDFLQATWHWPVLQMVLIAIGAMMAALLSVRGPLRRISEGEVAEVMSSGMIH